MQTNTVRLPGVTTDGWHYGGNLMNSDAFVNCYAF